MKRYEIYQAALPVLQGSHVQGGIRPVVIVSNDMANTYSPVITVVPLTTRMTKSSLPTHVVLLTSGLSAESLALCEQIITLDKARIRHYIGYVSDYDDRAALEHALSVQLGMAA